MNAEKQKLIEKDESIRGWKKFQQQIQISNSSTIKKILQRTKQLKPATKNFLHRITIVIKNVSMFILYMYQ